MNPASPISFPRDLENYHFFKRLQTSFGELGAPAMFLRLWIDLAFSARVHGRSGWLDPMGVQALNSAITGFHEGSLQAIADSGLIEPDSGGYFCKLFAECNPELDSGWIDPNSMIAARIAKASKAAKEEAKTLAAKIPPEAWEKEDGARVTIEQMNRALTLIRTLDGICSLPVRPDDAFTPGVVQSACRVLADYKDEAVAKFLHRIADRIRKPNTLPRNTEELLRQWHHALIEIYDKGFNFERLKEE